MRFSPNRQTVFYSYALLIVSFFLPIQVNSICIVLWLLVNFLEGQVQKNLFPVKPFFLLYTSLFLYLVIGLSYSENLKEGTAIVERHLSFLFVPLLIKQALHFSLSERRQLFHFFIGAATTLGLGCLAIACYKALASGSVYIPGKSGSFVYNYFMHQRLTEPLRMHAIYFSFFLSLGSLLLLKELLNLKQLTRSLRLSYTLCLCFFIVLLFLLKSSLFMAAFSLSCLLLLVFQLKTSIFSSPRKVGLFALLCIVVSSIAYRGIIEKIESFNTDFHYDSEHFSPLEIRMALWTASWELIQEKPLLGFGTGDATDAQLDFYRKNNFHYALQEKYNSHNMYLQYFLSNGLIALLLFVSLLFFLALRAWQNRAIILFLFVFLFASFSLTEATLLTQRGLTFFVFFSSLFYIHPHFWDFRSDTA
jgi:O-antigen ligase